MPERGAPCQAAWGRNLDPRTHTSLRAHTSTYTFVYTHTHTHTHAHYRGGSGRSPQGGTAGPGHRSISSTTMAAAQDSGGDCVPVTEASAPPPSPPETGLLGTASGVGGRKGCPLPAHHGSKECCGRAAAMTAQRPRPGALRRRALPTGPGAEAGPSARSQVPLGKQEHGGGLCGGPVPSPSPHPDPRTLLLTFYQARLSSPKPWAPTKAGLFPPTRTPGHSPRLAQREPAT